MQPSDSPFKLPINPPDYAPKQHGRNLALIYLRKSVVKGRVDQISIQYQLDVIMPTIWRDQLRFKIFIDNKRHNSARTEEGRADWLRLKVELRENPDALGVVMAFQDRGSRSTRDTIDLMEACESRGLHFIIPLNGIDTRQTGWTPHIKSMIRSNANLAETESELTSNRLIHRIGQYNRQGVPFGAPPFGMVRHGDGLEAVIKPNDDAPAAQRCLQLFASGMSYAAVADQLNNERVTFRDRRTKQTCIWRVESVRTVAGNILYYAGYLLPLCVERTIACRLEGDGDFLQRHINATKAQPTPHIAPLISDAAQMRQLANSVIQRRLRRRGIRDSDAWLTPMLRWAGKSMHSFIHQCDGKRYYRTRSGAGRMFNAQQLEEQMLETLSAAHFSDHMITDIRAAAVQRHADATHRELHQRIGELRAWQETTLKQFKHGRIAEADYEREHDEAQAEINKLQERLGDRTSVDELLALLGDLGGVLRLMPPLKRKTNLSRIFDIIEVNDAGEICALVPRLWAIDAFKTIIGAMCPLAGSSPTRPINVHMEGIPKIVALANAGMPV